MEVAAAARPERRYTPRNAEGLAAAATTICWANVGLSFASVITFADVTRSISAFFLVTRASWLPMSEWENEAELDASDMTVERFQSKSCSVFLPLRLNLLLEPKRIHGHLTILCPKNLARFINVTCTHWKRHHTTTKTSTTKTSPQKRHHTNTTTKSPPHHHTNTTTDTSHKTRQAPQKPGDHQPGARKDIDASRKKGNAREKKAQPSKKNGKKNLLWNSHFPLGNEPVGASLQLYRAP